MTRFSYGLICLDPVHQKTLVIQRRQSPEFIHFLRGRYQPKDISSIVEGCTFEEHEFIRQLIGLKYFAELRQRIIELLPQYPSDKILRHQAEMGARQLESHIDTFIDALNTVQPRLDYEWLWPKGGIEKGETPIECAIRETYEETGYVIPEDRIDPMRKITTEIAFAEFVLKNVYFILNWDSTIPAVGLPDYQEVRDAQWHSYQSIMGKLSLEHQKILRTQVALTGVTGATGVSELEDVSIVETM